MIQLADTGFGARIPEIGLCLLQVRSGSESITEYYMPEVRNIISFERTVLASVSKMNQYIKTCDHTQWDEIRDKLQNASVYLLPLHSTPRRQRNSRRVFPQQGPPCPLM